MLIRALVLLSCVGGIHAETSQSWPTWANLTSDSATANISDGFSSTKGWLIGRGMSAFEQATATYEKSQRILAAGTEKFSNMMLTAKGDAAIVASTDIWKHMFPLCVELGRIVMLKVNETLDEKIESAFRFQACTQNIRGTVCLTFIEDEIVDTIFDALWGPFVTTLGGSSLAVKIALGKSEKDVKKHLKPHILKAARPAAAVIHFEMNRLQPRLIQLSSIGKIDDALSLLKSEINKKKNDLLRKTENSVGPLCKAMGLKGNTADGKVQWSNTCKNNTKLSYGLEVKGRSLSISKMGATWDMKSVEMLRLYFPDCKWSSSQVKRKHWEMECTCWGNECTRCAYSEICGMMCAEGTKCKQFSFHGAAGLNICHPKTAAAPLLVGEAHLSGPPVKMCFVWTKSGVENVATENKAAEYGQPEVGGLVSAKVEKDFRASKYLETALKNKIIRSMSCPQYQMVSLAPALPAFWSSLAVVVLGLV